MNGWKNLWHQFSARPINFQYKWVSTIERLALLDAMMRPWKSSHPICYQVSYVLCLVYMMRLCAQTACTPNCYVMSEQSSVDFGLIVPRHPPIWDTDDIKLCQAESSWTMNPPRPHYTLSGTDRCVKHVLCPKICCQCVSSNKLKSNLRRAIQETTSHYQGAGTNG